MKNVGLTGKVQAQGRVSARHSRTPLLAQQGRPGTMNWRSESGLCTVPPESTAPGDTKAARARCVSLIAFLLCLWNCLAHAGPDREKRLPPGKLEVAVGEMICHVVSQGLDGLVLCRMTGLYSGMLEVARGSGTQCDVIVRQGVGIDIAPMSFGGHEFGLERLHAHLKRSSLKGVVTKSFHLRAGIGRMCLDRFFVRTTNAWRLPGGFVVPAGTRIAYGESRCEVQPPLAEEAAPVTPEANAALHKEYRMEADREKAALTVNAGKLMDLHPREGGVVLTRKERGRLRKLLGRLRRLKKYHDSLARRKGRYVGGRGTGEVTVEVDVDVYLTVGAVLRGIAETEREIARLKGKHRAGQEYILRRKKQANYRRSAKGAVITRWKRILGELKDTHDEISARLLRGERLRLDELRAAYGRAYPIRYCPGREADRKAPEPDAREIARKSELRKRMVESRTDRARKRYEARKRGEKAEAEHPEAAEKGKHGARKPEEKRRVHGEGEPPLPPHPARPVTPAAPMANSIGMRMVYIQAGSFRMGSKPLRDGEAKTSGSRGSALQHEHPEHAVSIAKGFYLGAHEVTVGQFRRFVEATAYRTDAENGDQPFADGITGGFAVVGRGLVAWREDATWRRPGFGQTDTHPVVLVSWDDAEAFCRWLSRKEGRDYRLPTEAEWEYACRGGTDTVYWWGDDHDTTGRVANVADRCANRENPQEWGTRSVMPMDDGHVYTSPVGAFRANAFGLYDMIGNVSEWCHDWYARDYYRKSPATDPTGPTEAEATRFYEGRARVVRGGAWCSRPSACRAAHRYGLPPMSRGVATGFRVLLRLPRPSE